MGCCGSCCIDIGELASYPPKKDQGFRKVIRAKCGKEIYTDIPGKTTCFECEKGSV